MRYRYGLALALALAPNLASAQEPEKLLSAQTQLYLRWDGIKAHRDAYQKTALGKMMQGDAGKFFDSAMAQLKDSLASALTVEGLLGGAPPDQVAKLQKGIAEAMKLPGLIGDHGFIFAAEVRSAMPPQGQVTLIIPGAGDKAEPLFGSIKLLASLGKVPVEEKKADGRTYNVLAVPAPVHVGWWVEGKHVILTVSTDSIEATAKRMRDGDHARLTDNPLYKKVAGFKDYPTAARAFLDVAAIAKIASGLHKEAKVLIEELGLDGMKSITFVSGFQDKAERSLIEIDLSGGRKGLLTLFAGGKPFKLSDVPPLPTDVTSWMMTNFDSAAFYDQSLHAAETIVRLIEPKDVPKIKQFIEQANQAIGIDIRKDLIGSLGNRIVSYNSPAEGPFSLGTTIMIRAKDPEKLQASLEQTVKGIANLAGGKVLLKKTKYRGVDLNQVIVKQQGFFFQPTWAVHDGWLVLGYFPQSVQGYVLRAKGELPKWEPGPAVKASLEKMPGEFLSVSVADPRPTVKLLLSLAPMAGAAINSFIPESKFDVSTIPNAHEVNRHLFPNVTVVEDDGKVLKIHTRASLALPFDISGLDTYLLAAFGVGFYSAAVGGQ